MLFSLYSFHFMSNNVFLNKTSLDSLNFVAIFRPLVVLDPLTFIFFIEYIFDFNPTNSSIITPPY